MRPGILPATGAVVGSPSVAPIGTKRPRPPRLLCPPFRPAARASSGVHSCAMPFSWAARPPYLRSRVASRDSLKQIRDVLCALRPQYPLPDLDPRPAPPMSEQGPDVHTHEFKACASAGVSSSSAANGDESGDIGATRILCRPKQVTWNPTNEVSGCVNGARPVGFLQVR